jgi:RNA polymerase sigma-70 factor (ECF subfamily)
VSGREFFPWFYRILRNLCLDHLKKKKRRDEVPLEKVNPGGERGVDFELQRTVWRGIEILPVEQREIIILRYFQSFSYQEIADILEKPIGSVMSSLFYAKKKLREIMET